MSKSTIMKPMTPRTPPPVESFEDFEEAFKAEPVEAPKVEKKSTRPKLKIAREQRPNRGPRKQLEQKAEIKRRMTFHVAVDVAKAFMVRCANEDRNMSAVAEQALQQYLDRTN